MDVEDSVCWGGRVGHFSTRRLISSPILKSSQFVLDFSGRAERPVRNVGDLLRLLPLPLELLDLRAFVHRHFQGQPTLGTQRPQHTATSNPDGAFGRSGIGGERAEFAITLRYLRERAAYYRDLSDKVADPVSGARYWDIAGTLDKAADALEANQPATEAPTVDSPDQ